MTDADVVIEAIVENLELKKEIFKKLDQYAPLGTILASNTSLQNISEMALPQTGRIKWWASSF